MATNTTTTSSSSHPAAAPSSPPPRYWLLTAPRTASNLLVRILNLGAQGVRPSYNGGYFFMGSREQRWPLLEKPMTEWTAEETAALRTAQQGCFDAYQDHVSASEAEGQPVFVKEHVMQLTDPYYEAGMNWGDETVSGFPEPEPLAFKKGENEDEEEEGKKEEKKASRSTLNRMSVPDEFLRTWLPTFLIRHPAVVFPSLYRARFSDEMMAFVKRKDKVLRPGEATFHFNRTLFDFYEEHFRAQRQAETAKAAAEEAEGGGVPAAATARRWPVVLDADDVMRHPALVVKYAEHVGLDPEKLVFEWGETNTDAFSPAEKRMLSSLVASRGVDLSKVAGEDIDIDAEAVKWRAEFGEQEAAALEKTVRDAMPDYEYMRARRLRLD